MKSSKGSKKRRKMFSAVVSLVLALGMMCSSVSSVFAYEGSSDEDVNVTEDTITVNGNDTVDITEADEAVTNDESAAKGEKNDEAAAGSSDNEKATDDQAVEKSEQSGKDKTGAAESTDKEKKKDVTYRAKDSGVKVKVTAPEGALPDDAELSVTLYDEDSGEYADAAKAVEKDAKSDANMAAMDISFMSDGEEIEPTEPVTVSIDASKILPKDADAGTMKVQHLEENKNGVDAVVVADASGNTKGTIDESNATAEFTVDSFSVFTVEWNDGTTDTVEVHSYNMNGTSIDEELDEPSTEIASGGTIEIQELVEHMESHSNLSNVYTYQYATVVYETAQGGAGYSLTTIGSQNDPVVSISKTGTTYTVTTASGTTTVSDPADIEIHMYYSTPSVTIETTNPYDDVVNFTTENEYFQGDTSSATYTWAVSNDSLGTLTHDTPGEATFTWSEDAQSGDQVTVTVTMTVGDETASDAYTLTYGDEAVTITVYAQDGTTVQENAHVALVDENGNTVATGTTGSDGTVTLYAPAGTYTVGVTYAYLVSEIGGGSTSRAEAEGTITVPENGTAEGSVTLGTAVTSGPGGDTSGSNGGGDEPYYYEHVDVKVAVAETSTSNVTFSDLDAVYVYDKYGNLIYRSEDIVSNPGTTDYNILFDINGDEDQHSIVVSSEDTIVIAYEVINEDGTTSTYTVSYQGGGTYPDDEYYPYDSINAYQLYNILYGTEYEDQDEFEADWGPALAGYNEAGIAIGGISYSMLADYLCDTRTTAGQSGLDFVIDIQDLSVVFGDYGFRVAKTLEDAPSYLDPESFETFNFNLQELYTVSDSDTYTEGIWSTADGNIAIDTSGSTSDWTQGDNGNWQSLVDFDDSIIYEAEDGTYFYYFVLSEDEPTTATADQQYYGLKVTVTYSASTGVAEIIASYCDLTKVDDTTYNRASGWTELEPQTGVDENGEEFVYFAVPYINTFRTTGFDLEKVDENGAALDGAVFNMSIDGTTLYFTYDSDNNTYVLASEDTAGASADITVVDGGPVGIEGLAEGTYTLTEVTAPNGYASIDDFTVTIDAEGNVTVDGDNVSAEDDVVTVENDLDTYDFSLTKTDSSTQAQIDGAIFSLYTSEDDANAGTNAIGFVYDSDTNTYTATDEMGADTGIEIGSATIAGLTAGTYYLKEISAPDGYEDLEGLITITITVDDEGTATYTVDGNNASIDGNAVTIANDAITYEFTLDKVDEDGVALDGAEFSLYTDEACTDIITFTQDGTTYTASDEGDVTTITAGSVTIAGLTAGTYYMKETKPASDDYVHLTDVIEITITGNDDGSATVTVDGTPYVTADSDAVTVENEFEWNVDISGEKTWDDADDQDGIRPDSITIHLLADGEPAVDHEGNVITAEITAADNWAWEFTDLPKYQLDSYPDGDPIEDADGNFIPIVYTIEEDAVEGYDDPVYDDDQLNVTNSYTPETIDISGTKTWDDNDDEYGQQPNSITVRLLADGKEIDKATVRASDDWTWEFTELPKYRDGGIEINYTVTEDAIDDYTTEYDGYDVTNTWAPDELSVTVVKGWYDGDDADNIRPDSITVELLSNGEETGETMVIDESTNWQGSFTGLDKYDSETHEQNEYTIEEVNVGGYTTDITGDASKGYVISNFHTPETPGAPVDNPDNIGSNGSDGSVGTGDDSNMMMWLMILITAALICATLIVIERRRQRS